MLLSYSASGTSTVYYHVLFHQLSSPPPLALRLLDCDLDSSPDATLRLVAETSCSLATSLMASSVAPSTSLPLRAAWFWSADPTRASSAELESTVPARGRLGEAAGCRVFLCAKIASTMVYRASIVSWRMARTWQFESMSKCATIIFQILSMRETFTRAVSTSRLMANVLIWARISLSVVVLAFDAVENMGLWKFSSTPTVSYARAQMSSARLCMSKRSVLVNRESKDS